MLKRLLSVLWKSVILLILLGVGYLVYLVVALLTVFGVFDQQYSRDDMVVNYEEHRQAFASGAAELRAIFSPNYVSIELDGDEVSILHTRIDSSYNSNWPHGDRSYTDSILRRLDVDTREFARIAEILSELECIGFSNFRKEDKFAYQRSGFGMYTYLIFPAPLSDSSLIWYRESCSHEIYTPSIIFEYGSGAIGSDCLRPHFSK